MRLTLLLLLTTGSQATAQTWTTDTNISRLPWEAVNVLVRPDSLWGVHVWAHTSPVHHIGLPKRFSGYFDPAVLLPWIERANTLVRATQTPDSGALALQTPPLPGLDGSALVLRRTRHGTQWASNTRVYFLHVPTASSWYVQVPTEQALALLRALFQQALTAQDLPVPHAPPEPSITDTLNYPVELAGNPDPVYPPGLVTIGLVGEVWLSFVVQPDGAVAPASFRVYLSDNPAFAEAAVRGIAQARYRPGVYLGRPVPVRVYELVYFHLGGPPSN